MPDQIKLVRDIMVDVFEYPHVPYWFTVRQVAGILKKSISGGNHLHPQMCLIFDEKYNLMGHIELRDILNGAGQAASAGKKGLKGTFSDNSASGPLATLAEQPSGSLMVPAKLFADPEDTVATAAEVMIENNLSFIPVLENKKKLVGIIRSAEIFDYLSAAYLRA